MAKRKERTKVEAFSESVRGINLYQTAGLLTRVTVTTNDGYEIKCKTPPRLFIDHAIEKEKEKWINEGKLFEEPYYEPDPEMVFPGAGIEKYPITEISAEVPDNPEETKRRKFLLHRYNEAMSEWRIKRGIIEREQVLVFGLIDIESFGNKEEWITLCDLAGYSIPENKNGYLRDYIFNYLLTSGFDQAKAFNGVCACELIGQDIKLVSRGLNKSAKNMDMQFNESLNAKLDAATPQSGNIVTEKFDELVGVAESSFPA